MAISSLNEDALLNIFLLCSEADLEEGSYVAKLDWDWIIVSHVCGYWRKLAISSPTLWSRPTLARHSRDRLEAFLKRSQNVPLIITTFYKCKISYVESGDCASCRDNVILALNHMSRIRHLNILSLSNYDILLNLSENSAPLLQDLCLVSANREPNFTKPTRLPPDFVTEAQSMRSLVLKGFYIPYDSQILRGLERLQIYHYSYSPFFASLANCYPTVTQLLGILDASPALRDLELFTIRDPTDTELIKNNYGSSKIHLPFLYSLRIHEIEIGFFKKFRNYIDILIGVDISIGLRFTDVKEFDQILDVLLDVSKFNNGDSGEVRLLDIIIELELNGALEAYSRGSISTRLSLYQVGESGFRLNEREIDYDDVSEMTMNLIRCSHWKNVTKLNFTVSSHYALVTEDEWRTFLDVFKSTDDLTIRVDDTGRLCEPDYDQQLQDDIVLLQRNLLSALTLPPIHDDPQCQNSYILPCLEKLSLDISSISHISTEVLHCTKIRSECGCPIRNLCIFPVKDSRPIDENWRSEIENYVDHFKLYEWH